MLRKSFCEFNRSHIPLCAIVLLILSPSLFAQSLQSESSAADQQKTRQVFAAASDKLIRFTSPGELIQIRLEVIGASGEVLFDSDFKSANVVDWSLTDKQGQQLADGSYLCAVTVKDSSGRATRKLALAGLHDQSVSLKQFDGSLLTAAQADAAGASSSEDISLTILEPGGSTASAVLAHDGSAAHLVSGSGGLSISSGDFFAKKVTEQVRLTAEGNLGIGVANPQAKLDVAGRIRASEGVIFPDGSIQFSAASKTLGAKSVRADQQQRGSTAGQEQIEPQASGTGTQNRLAKWMDNAGTLGNSSVTDTGYLAIDSNSNPLVGGSGSLIIQGNSNKERVELRSAGAITGPALQGRGYGGTIAAPTATQAGHNLFIIGGSGHDGSDIKTYNAGVIKIMAEENWTQTANGAYINFETTPSGRPTSARAERMRITGDGRVGIGTTNPSSSSRLHIEGFTLHGVYGTSTGTSGIGVFGTSTGTSGYGVYGSSSSGTGVYGFSNNGYAGQFAGKVYVNGRVGIGITDPTYQLEVRGASSFGGVRGTTASGVGVLGDSTSFDSVWGISDSGDGVYGQSNSHYGVFGRSTSYDGVYGESNSGTGVKGSSTSGGGVWGNSASGIGVYGASATGYAGRFDGKVYVNGSVGIGITDPEAALHVAAGDGYIGYGAVRGTTTVGAGVSGRATTGTGVFGGSTSGPGVSGGSTSGPGVSADSYSGHGVHGTSFSGYGVFGMSNNNYAGYFSGNVYVTGTVTQGSDVRFKQDVSNLNYGLREVLRLRPVTWTWKQKPQQGLQLGLVAQEVEAVLPELVTTGKDAEQTKGINYIGLVPVVIKAIQEQQATITTLQAVSVGLKAENATLKQQNAELQERITTLDARLTALEQMVQQLKTQAERSQAPHQ